MKTYFENRYRMRYNGDEFPVYRVNLHAHSNGSGGIFTPSMTRELYADDGALAITDTDSYEELPPDTYHRLTSIPGVEWKLPGPRGREVTLLVYGLNQIASDHPATLAEALKLVEDKCAQAYVAHPHLSGLRPSDILQFPGHVNGIEIYNANARKAGQEYSLNTWDCLLDDGMPFCSGIATDGFFHPDSFRCGWIMVCAKDNSVESLLTAMRQRRFYCSQGPRFTCLEYKNRHFHAEFTSAVEALLIGNTPHVPERFNAIVERCQDYPWPGTNPNASYLESGVEYEEAATSIDADLSTWADTGFVRCQIRDRLGHYAWSQAFVL